MQVFIGFDEGVIDHVVDPHLEQIFCKSGVDAFKVAAGKIKPEYLVCAVVIGGATTM